MFGMFPAVFHLDVKKKQLQLNMKQGNHYYVVDNHSHWLQIVLMIICICRRLNEKKISEAIDAGAESAPAVMAHHQTRFNCGQCRHDIAEMISNRQDIETATDIAAE